jgi:hypothetical protein
MNLIENGARRHAILFALSLCRGVQRRQVKSGGRLIGSVREVGLSLSVVELPAFGSMSAFALAKYA